MRRTLIAVCAVAAAVVLLLSTVGWLGLRHYEGKVNHVALTFPAGVDRPESAGRGAQAILLVGSDSREGSSAEAPGQRSDTTLLAYLRPDGTTTLLSFPRDLWVVIPAYTDSAGVSHEPQESKLNAAYAYGGASLLIRTIEGL
nr:LCP family protein [Micromonospora sp. DSM 115978]